MISRTPVMTRRSFAFGVSGAAGGLLLTSTPLAAWGRAADIPDQPLTASEVTIWVVIEPDDTTVIRVARSEMGQGSFTALPMLVAEELECDWSRVRAEYVDPRENVVKGRPWGDMVTAASLAIRGSQSYLPRPARKHGLC
jgi:isoquinoline 1-oxidoreductase subunit beta